MGNQDAPKAPAGWYSIEEGKPGERYWDGNAWSGETRGIVIPKSSADKPEEFETTKKNQSGWWVAVGVLIVIAIFFAASGGKGVETDAQKQERIKKAAIELLAKQKVDAAAAEAAKPVVPDGFTYLGDGMSWLWLDGHCSYVKCAHFQIYSDSECSTVYVEGNSEDASGLIYGLTNDMIGVMHPGDSAIAELPVLEQGATAVRITKIICN